MCKWKSETAQKLVAWLSLEADVPDIFAVSGFTLLLSSLSVLIYVCEKK